MAESWFVQPDETRRIALSDGQWIVLKARLSIGAMRALYVRKYELNPETKDFQVRMDQVGIADVAAYLVDWSLPDLTIRGASIDVIEAAVRNLLPDRFFEIEAAVDAQVAAVDAERLALKKTSFGGNTSSPISTSPDAAIGATSGSALSTPLSMTSSLTS